MTTYNNAAGRILDLLRACVNDEGLLSESDLQNYVFPSHIFEGLLDLSAACGWMGLDISVYYESNPAKYNLYMGTHKEVDALLNAISSRGLDGAMIDVGLLQRLEYVAVDCNSSRYLNKSDIVMLEESWQSVMSKLDRKSEDELLWEAHGLVEDFWSLVSDATLRHRICGLHPLHKAMADIVGESIIRSDALAHLKSQLPEKFERFRSAVEALVMVLHPDGEALRQVETAFHAMGLGPRVS